MDTQKDSTQFFHKRKASTLNTDYLTEANAYKTNKIESISHKQQLKLYKAQSKKATIPEPFLFMTEIRSCIRLLKKVDGEENLDRPIFKARKIPKSLFEHLQYKKVEAKLENEALNTHSEDEGIIPFDSPQHILRLNTTESAFKLEEERLSESDNEFVKTLNKSEEQEEISLKKIEFNGFQGWDTKYEQLTKEFFSKLISFESAAYSESFDEK